MTKKQVNTEEEFVPGVATTNDETEWKHATATVWNPKAGEFIIGKYDGSSELDETIIAKMRERHPTKDFSRKILQHFVMVDLDGQSRRYSLIGGEKIDNAILNSSIKKGTLVRIEYLGQIETSGGNRMNDWDVRYKD